MLGAKVLGSCACMDKVYTKIILNQAKINQVKYAYIRKFEDKYVYIDENFNENVNSLDDVMKNINKKLEFLSL